MFYTTSIKRLFTLFFLGLVITGLASCSSSSTPGASNTNTGTVALLMTDAPSADFDEINITVIKAELLSDGGAVTIFQGDRTYNLLDLTDARIFAIREGVPAGSYSKIRLTLTKIELVDYDDQADPNNYLTYSPKLPGNGKLDLNPRGSFDVVAGGTLTIQIDMDGNKSIHIVGTGKDKYQFRPVVFITIVTDDFTQRYVKLYGDVEAIDSTDQSFNLCNTNIPVQIDNGTMDDSSRGCLRVTTDASTSIFDSNGMPAGFIDLVEGQPATVFGYLQRNAGSDIDNSFASATASKANDDDYDHDENDNDNDDNGLELGDLVLKAALIELGPEGGFLKLKGTANSAVNIDDLFTMAVDPGQGLTTTTPPLIINVQIQDGTILINRQGDPVASTDIDTGKLVAVRGVLDVSTDTLFASLIIVDTDSSSQLTGGTIGINPDNSCGFSLLSAENENGAIISRSVATDSNTRAFLVTTSSSTPINVTDLSEGQQADVYGNDNNATGCFDAHTIIAY